MFVCRPNKNRTFWVLVGQYWENLLGNTTSATKTTRATVWRKSNCKFHNETIESHNINRKNNIGYTALCNYCLNHNWTTTSNILIHWPIPWRSAASKTTVRCTVTISSTLPLLGGVDFIVETLPHSSSHAIGRQHMSWINKYLCGTMSPLTLISHSTWLCSSLFATKTALGKSPQTTQQCLSLFNGSISRHKICRRELYPRSN